MNTPQLAEEQKVIDYENIEAKQVSPLDQYDNIKIYSAYKNEKRNEDNQSESSKVQKSPERVGSFNNAVFRIDSNGHSRNPSVQNTTMTSFRPSHTKVIFDNENL